jgi:hypothetical protein
MKTQSKLQAATILAAGILSLNTFAGPTATQTVTYEVTAINELAVSAATASLTVNAAASGSAPTAITDATTSYEVL